MRQAGPEAAGTQQSERVVTVKQHTNGAEPNAPLAKATASSLEGGSTGSKEG
jgi:hypothetical protein